MMLYFLISLNYSLLICRGNLSADSISVRADRSAQLIAASRTDTTEFKPTNPISFSGEVTHIIEDENGQSLILKYSNEIQLVLSLIMAALMTILCYRLVTEKRRRKEKSALFHARLTEVRKKIPEASEVEKIEQLKLELNNIRADIGSVARKYLIDYPAFIMLQHFTCLVAEELRQHAEKNSKKIAPVFKMPHEFRRMSDN